MEELSFFHYYIDYFLVIKSILTTTYLNFQRITRFSISGVIKFPHIGIIKSSKS